MKEFDIQNRFLEKVQASETNREVEDLKNIWTGLKDCLLQVTEEVCGRTKGLQDTLHHGGEIRMWEN